MYKKIVLLICIGIFSYNGTLHAQLITVDETDPDNKTFLSVNNADINSRLTIKFDKTALLQRVAGTGAPLPDDVMTLVGILQKALQNKQAMLGEIRQTIKTYKAQGVVDRAAALEFNRKMQGYAIAITDLFAADPVLEKYYAEDTGTGLFASIYPALDRRINELLAKLIAKEGSDHTLRLGAWLVRDGVPAPVHLEGFDTLPQGEFYEVERWNYLPTPAQLKEFEAMQTLARESEFAEADIKNILLDNYAVAIVNFLKEKFNDDLTAFRTEAEKIISTGIPAEMVVKVQNLVDNGKTFIDLIKQRGDYYVKLKGQPDFSLSQLLSNLTRDLQDINSSQKALVKNLSIIKTDIAALAPAVRQKFTALVSLTDQALQSLKVELFGSQGLDILDGANDLAGLAFDFADEVIKHALLSDNLPTQTSLDLRYTGKRSEGDRIYIKLEVRSGKGILTQESREIGLFRMAPHLEGTVGVIFAHPLSQTAIQKDFQMAPYYNLLFKGIFGGAGKKKRQKKIYNTLLDFSWGLHVSSPDFNKDDVPELGVGIVLSGFKDYLQAGWAYNLFESTGYVFFGIRLPVPSMNFGSGGQVSTIGQ